MTDSKIQSIEHQLKSERLPMSRCETAGRYVRQMVEKESKGWGDEAEALKRLSSRYRISFWTLNNLRIRRAKSVNEEVFPRIRAAYLDFCEKHIARLQHELELEKAVNVDADMEDFMGEASQLLAKVREAKKTSKTTARTTRGG
ncbi:hypothetical protein ACFW0F_06065 [Brucella anthropi]|uniref:hypothetical protein n=1 Tax=Brucella anthropi TaxID=529 RepID=UPI003672D05A